MTLPSIVSGSLTANVNTNSGVSSFTMAKPSGVVDGDLIVVVVRGQITTATADWACSASPFTRAGLPGLAFQANDAERMNGIFYRPIASAAAETATSYVFTNAGGAGRVNAVIFILRGVNLASIEADNSGSASGVDGTSITNGRRVASQTLSVGNVLGIKMAGNELVSGNANAATLTQPGSAWTNIYNAPTSSSTTVSRSSLVIDTASLASAGATDQLDTTWSAAAGPSAMAVWFNGTSSATPVTATGTGSIGVTATESQAQAVGVSGTSSQSVAAGSNAAQSVGVSGTSSVTLVATEAQSKTITIAGTSAPIVATGPVQTWLASQPLNVAHFGGDADWPPGLVLYAYQLAARWNAGLAFEVDVWPTTDGVWVVQHDNTTDTNFGTSGNVITSSTWASISGLTTTVGGYPIMRLETLLTAFPTRAMMIDNKGQLNMSALLTLLNSYGGSSNFIAKGFCTSTSWADAATAQGYQSWGYYYDADVATNLPNTASHWSLLGMDILSASSADWTAVKAYGKPVLAHIVATAAQKATAVTRGANGFMASGVQEVIPQTPMPLSVTGSSSQAITSLQLQSTSAGVSGSGSQSVFSSQAFVAAVGASGSGSVSVGLKQAEAIAAAVSGAGTQSASSKPAAAFAVTASGTGSQTVGKAQQVATSVSASGTGTPSVLAGSNATQSVTNTGSGSLSVSEAMRVVIVASISGAGSQSISSMMREAAAVSIAGAAAIGLIAGMATSTTVSNTGAGSATVTASSVAMVSAAIAGAGSVTVMTSAVVNPVRNIVVTSSLLGRQVFGSLAPRSGSGSLGARSMEGSLS